MWFIPTFDFNFWNRRCLACIKIIFCRFQNFVRIISNFQKFTSSRFLYIFNFQNSVPNQLTTSLPFYRATQTSCPFKMRANSSYWKIIFYPADIKSAAQTFQKFSPTFSRSEHDVSQTWSNAWPKFVNSHKFV